MLAKRLIKSNDAGGGACTNTVDLYNPFPDGGGVALYQLNGDATDVSGNYNGTASNVTYGTGVFGQAGVFNGSSSYINTNNLYLPANDDWTVSLWIKPRTTLGDGSEAIFTQYFPSQAGRMVVNWQRDAGDEGRIQYAIGTYNSSNTLPIAFPTDNVWYHFVMIRNSSGIQMYVDNSKIVSNGPAQSIYQGQPLRFGGDENWGVFGESNIDQVRIFNRALRPYEVEALYTEEYCTPTIVPSEHFNTVTYDGTGGSNSITSVGFQPDLTWIKGRDSAWNHLLYDSVRGAAKELHSNTTDAEGSDPNILQSFNANGFTLGSSGEGNFSGQNYVSWNFKAGGSAVTNTDGTITSQVSANTEAGFSVVSYTGNGISGATIGHGLGVEPSMLIIKNRDITSNWAVYHTSVGVDATLLLNTTDAEISVSGKYSGTNQNVFGVNSAGDVNQNNNSMIAYCFAEVEGFSNFGSYVGNGSTSGNVITTGFEPAFLLIKRTNGTNDWILYDNKRNTTNPRDTKLSPNTSNAEYTAAGINIDFLENGFQIKGNDSAINASSGTGEYIYMAFAADPTTIEPTLEDSFNTVLWTGDDVYPRDITSVGFQPDFVWLKARNTSGQTHWLTDSVRGGDKKLISQQTAAEIDNDGLGYISEFLSNGIRIDSSASNSQFNGVPYTYVGWFWKGAELPAINSNGSIPSVVSANPAAGFSIVSYTGNGLSNQTIGHGLGQTPDVIITKGRANLSTYDSWDVWHKDLTLNYVLFLNNTDAEGFAGVDQRFVTSLNSSDVFGVGPDIYGPNSNTTTKIAYCFAEVAGFSKFGSYTGVSGGVTVDVGFEPAFVMVKCTNNAEAWAIIDNKRTSPAALFPPSSQAEATSSGFTFTFTSTGFSFPDQAIADAILNQDGYEYIYMAFANQF